MILTTDSSGDFNKFTELAARCDKFLRFAREVVDSIPARRQRALNERDEAEARLRQARQDQIRAHTDNSGKWNEDVAEEAASEARIEVASIDSYLSGPDFDVEFEKAFARQLASLLREDCTRRLDDIAARNDDPALRQTVDEYKDGFFASVNRLLKDFKEAAPLHPSEVRQARAEAERCLRRKDPPFL
jgi:hypothetical protein